MKDAIYIIRDLAEAKKLQRLKLQAEAKALSLSPTMQKILREINGLHVITSDEIYGNISHLKTIIYIKKGIDEFREATTKGNFSELQIEAAIYSIFYIFSTAAFFYQVMRKFKKFYYFKNENITSNENFDEAFKDVIAEIFQLIYANKEHGFSAPHRWLMAAYNSYISTKLKSQKKLLILDNVRPVSKNFATEVLKLDKNFIILKSQTPNKSILSTIQRIKKSLRTLKNKNYLGNFTPIYFIYPAKTKGNKSALNKVISQTRNHFHQLTLQAAKPFILNFLENAAGYEASNCIEHLKPQIVTSDMFYKASIMATAAQAKQRNAAVIMFNHASHASQTTAASKQIVKLLASRNIVHSPYATHLAIRSPAAAKLSAEIYPGGNIIGVRHDNFIPPSSNKKFQILFAGNYLGIEEHVPWMQETPDEFIRGIAELAAAVSKLPDAELTIRIKPDVREDITPEIIKELIPAYPNVTFSNEGSFKQALQQTDLMVASITTTIDEALHSGRPVLLHSYRKNYFHLPVMTEPPEENRSAVYASTRAIPLEKLLRAIINSHHHKPLSTTELAPYIWPKNTADMAGFAKQIVENLA